MIIYSLVSNNGWHVEQIDTEKSRLLYNNTILYCGTLYSGAHFRTEKAAYNYIYNGVEWFADLLNNYELEKIYRGVNNEHY